MTTDGQSRRDAPQDLSAELNPEPSHNAAQVVDETNDTAAPPAGPTDAHSDKWLAERAARTKNKFAPFAPR